MKVSAVRESEIERHAAERSRRAAAPQAERAPSTVAPGAIAPGAVAPGTVTPGTVTAVTSNTADRVAAKIQGRQQSPLPAPVAAAALGLGGAVFDAVESTRAGSAPGVAPSSSTAPAAAGPATSAEIAAAVIEGAALTPEQVALGSGLGARPANAECSSSATPNVPEPAPAEHSVPPAGLAS